MFRLLNNTKIQSKLQLCTCKIYYLSKDEKNNKIRLWCRSTDDTVLQ